MDVLPEECSAPGRYEVVEAPGIVEARAEADAAEFVIVVRRY